MSVTFGISKSDSVHSLRTHFGEVQTGEDSDRLILYTFTMNHITLLALAEPLHQNHTKLVMHCSITCERGVKSVYVWARGSSFLRELSFYIREPLTTHSILPVIFANFIVPTN